MVEDVDWTHRGAYMHARHGITVEVAHEVVSDPERLVIDPDYNSGSGNSIRVIGYSPLAGAIVTVIVLVDDGVVHGVNGWIANTRDQQLYREEGDHGQD